MDKQEIVSRINGIFTDEFEIPPEKITPEANIVTDLGLDSLDIVELMIRLQQIFTVQIQDSDEVRAIRTMGQLYEFVFKTVEKPAPACEPEG